VISYARPLFCREMLYHVNSSKILAVKKRRNETQCRHFEKCHLSCDSIRDARNVSPVPSDCCYRASRASLTAREAPCTDVCHMRVLSAKHRVPTALIIMKGPRATTHRQDRLILPFALPPAIACASPSCAVVCAMVCARGDTRRMQARPHGVPDAHVPLKSPTLWQSPKPRSRCKDCEGASICAHRRVRRACKDCKRRKPCVVCSHRKLAAAGSQL